MMLNAKDLAPETPVLIAPDKFKGTLGAEAVASAIAAGLADVRPSAAIRCLPLADGGDGTLDVVLNNHHGRRIEVPTCDALGHAAGAAFALLDNGTAVIESAAICGLHGLDGEQRSPLRTTTRGLGPVLDAARHAGARKVLVGLGGSATVDGGLGLLIALGAVAPNGSGQPVAAGGRGLLELASLDLAPAQQHVRGLQLEVLCDVASPLLGPDGARLYMAQKGADEALSAELELGLSRMAALAEEGGADRALRRAPGAGAAGGLGYALALLGGSLVSGAAAICDLTGFDAALGGCQMVVTGEGRLDSQTLHGKVVAEVAKRARQVGARLAVVCGVDALDDAGRRALGADLVLEAAPGSVATADDLRRAGRRIGQAR